MSVKTPLWKPSEARIQNAAITKYIEFVNRRYGTNCADYFDLHGWSVSNIADFWASVWEFVGIKASKRYDRVVDDLTNFPGATWFPGAELNFAETSSSNVIARMPLSSSVKQGNPSVSAMKSSTGW
jgi:acetoacetyl-CoA synthetase